MSEKAPLVIEFIPGSRCVDEAPEDVAVGHPLSGKVVRLPNGERLKLPHYQVVSEQEIEGRASVEIDGMSFEGIENDEFVFWRVKDLWPEEVTGADYTDKWTVNPAGISRILFQGRQVWPKH